MCPPLFFDVIHYGLNPYMVKNTMINRDRAITQWLNLYIILRSFGIRVYTVKPVENLVDMVFSANCGYIHNNIFILTKFKDIYRREEIKYYTKYIAKLGYKTILTKNGGSMGTSGSVAWNFTQDENRDWIANTPMDVDGENKEILENIIELLDENDDVQDIYHAAKL